MSSGYSSPVTSYQRYPVRKQQQQGAFIEVRNQMMQILLCDSCATKTVLNFCTFGSEGRKFFLNNGQLFFQKNSSKLSNVTRGIYTNMAFFNESS